MKSLAAVTAAFAIALVSPAPSLAQVPVRAPAPAAFDPALHAAVVGTTPITLADASHWMTIAISGTPETKATSDCSVALPGPGKRLKQLREQVSTFLIRGAWLEAEAAERGIVTNAAEVKRSFNRARRQAFPRKADYLKFLKSSCQTESDLLTRQRLQIVERRITKNVMDEAKTAKGKQRRLARFGSEYAEKWRARTYCADGYVTSDCANAE